MDPFYDFRVMQSRMNRIFDEAFGDPFINEDPFYGSRLLRNRFLGLLDDMDSETRRGPQKSKRNEGQHEKLEGAEESKRQATESRVVKKADEGALSLPRSIFHPHMDVSEDEKAITIHAELPGIAKENVKIDINDDILTISGEKSVERNEQDPSKKYHRIERRHGQFSRSIKIPNRVDPQSIKAVFKDGLLDVTIPKPEVANQKTSIAINIQ